VAEHQKPEDIDADILECKGDVLRARDIIPGDGKNNPTPPPSQNETQSRIPQFDLASDIMAEQRRLIAAKRKGPGKKTETEVIRPRVAAARAVEQPLLHDNEQDELLREIVKRDIEKLLAAAI
jgi:hypothetical protein